MNPRTFRALAAIAVLLALAAIAVLLAINLKSDPVAKKISCDKGEIPVSLDMPADPSTVKLAIFNSTTVNGLAGQASGDFISRKFTVTKVATAKGKPYAGVALIKYGPKTVGTAWLIKAYFLNEAELSFDKKNKTDVVTIILGQKFRALASETEKNQSIAAAGKPTLPVGTCGKD